MTDCSKVLVSRVAGAGFAVAVATAFALMAPVHVFAAEPTPAPAAAGPSGPEQALRVLLPATSAQIEAAFAAAAPTWRLEKAAIDKDHVTGVACVGELCHAFALTDARPGCDATAAGAFCLRWTGTEPAEAATLVAALSSVVDATIWHVIPARVVQPPAVPAAEQPIAAGTRSPNSPAPTDPQGAELAADATMAAAAPGSSPTAPATAAQPTTAPAQSDAAVAESAPAEDDDGALARMLIFALLFAVAAGFVLMRTRGGDKD